jgi:hypothetical protein
MGSLWAPYGRGVTRRNKFNTKALFNFLWFQLDSDLPTGLFAFCFLLFAFCFLLFAFFFAAERKKLKNLFQDL